MAEAIIHSLRFPKRSRHEDADVDDDLERASQAIGLSAGGIVEYPGPTPVKAGVPFRMPHGLQVRPDWVTMLDTGDQGGVIYANRNDKRQWNDRIAVVRCTVAGETGLTVKFTRKPSA